jgi:hypothetical protein
MGDAAVNVASPHVGRVVAQVLVRVDDGRGQDELVELAPDDRASTIRNLVPEQASSLSRRGVEKSEDVREQHGVRLVEGRQVRVARK